MLGWVRPKILVPVHGEPLHMAEHAAIGRRAGVGQVLLSRDGELLRLAPGEPGKIDELPAGRLYKDGSLLVSAEERTVADRRRLGFAGIVSVSLAVSDRGELLAEPEVSSPEFPKPICRDAGSRRSPMRLPSRPSNRCRVRAGATLMPSPRRCGARPAQRSARAPGTRNRHVTCMSSKYEQRSSPSATSRFRRDDDRTAQPRGDRGPRHRRGCATSTVVAGSGGVGAGAAAGPRRDDSFHLVAEHQDRVAGAARR